MKIILPPLEKAFQGGLSYLRLWQNFHFLCKIIHACVCVCVTEIELKKSSSRVVHVKIWEYQTQRINPAALSHQKQLTLKHQGREQVQEHSKANGFYQHLDSHVDSPMKIHTAVLI